MVPVIVEFKYPLVKTVERGIPHGHAVHFESARDNLVGRRWLQVEAEDLSRKGVDAAVEVRVAGVRVALDDVAEDVETFGSVDVDHFAVHVQYVSGIDGCGDSVLYLVYVLWEHEEIHR